MRNSVGAWLVGFGVAAAIAGCKGGSGFGDMFGGGGGNDDWRNLRPDRDRDRDRDRDQDRHRDDHGRRGEPGGPVTGNAGEIGKLQSQIDGYLRNKDLGSTVGACKRIQVLTANTNPPGQLSDSDYKAYINDRNGVAVRNNTVLTRAQGGDLNGARNAKGDFDAAFNAFIARWFRGG